MPQGILRTLSHEALITEGALQSAIFNSINFSCIATDTKGVIQIFSMGAERMLGYAAKEVVNRITPADISDLEEVIARAKNLSLTLYTHIEPGFEALIFNASRGIEDIYELTYIRKDGSRFPAMVSVTALRDEEDLIIGYLLIGTDNTARKKIEKERTKLDQRLRDLQFYTQSLFEASIDAIITTNPEGIVTDVNQRMEVLTARTRSELIGSPFNRHFTDPHRAQAVISKALSNGKLTNYELTALSQDKQETVVSCNAAIFYDQEKRVRGVFAAARVVTAQKAAEHALRTSEMFSKSTLDAASSPICVLNKSGEILAVNRAWCDGADAANKQPQHMNFSSGIGSNYLDLCDEASGQYATQAALLAKSIRRVIEDESQELTIEYAAFTATEKSWFLARITRFHGDSANVVVAHVNITERKIAALREHHQHRVVQLLAAKAPFEDVLSAIARNVEEINENLLCSIELLAKDGRNSRIGAAPSLPDFFKSAIGDKSVMDDKDAKGRVGQEAISSSQRFLTKDDACLCCLATYQKLADQYGIHSSWAQSIVSAQDQQLGIFTIYQRHLHVPSNADLQLVQDQASLVAVAIEKIQAETQQRLAASVFSHVREAIMITDAAGMIVEVNETFSRITGHEQSDAAGKPMRMLSSNQQSHAFFLTMWHELVEKGHWSGETLSQRKNGDNFASMLSISAVRDTLGATQNYVALFSDITLMKQHAEQLEHIAHYDSLTHLPNRVLLADRLKQALLNCKRRGNSLAVVFLDLDNFKKVNDEHGHNVGDELLVTLAQRMKAALRSGDTLARLGGDEFVAILVDMQTSNDYEQVVHRLLEAASSPVMTTEHELCVSASIGVTIYPHDDGDADLLIRHADQAMYAAKQTGRNRYNLFDMDLEEAMLTRHSGLENIRQALENKEFVLFYQPKINMATNEVVGSEALIRWQHPTRGLLSPADFLPLIENHPLSVMVGEWVIETALKQLSIWRGMGLNIPVSVNIGARQLQEDEFEAHLTKALEAHRDVPSHCLELEVLESSALEDMNKISRVMRACCALGVRFLLDDFGTGHSSLTHLRRLPADVIKIDQSFVRDMLEDSEDLAIVKGVIALAVTLKLEIIAEGVETKAHGDMLISLGCTLAQGYGIARPMPEDKLPNWVKNWHTNPAWTA
ncbi:putative signaling protein [Polaromonas vacuolata]|uniref:Putative signaling protein n=1 Tax=Polaromonas vacuolata TaxID=37448 RepID=A0A6H2HBV8_9BURK|nr:EAL domain-containing protein [Polaromonas vacuolata]QJC57359.1 putative signaling protein [Polaromonas vacuolata]